MEDIEEEVPMSAHYLKQLEENNIMKKLPNEMYPISPDDDDDQHLVAMGDVDPDNMAMVMHQALHIQQKIEKGTVQQETNPMLNGAMSQAMSQAGSQTAKLNTNQ